MIKFLTGLVTFHKNKNTKKISTYIFCRIKAYAYIERNNFIYCVKFTQILVIRKRLLYPRSYYCQNDKELSYV